MSQSVTDANMADTGKCEKKPGIRRFALTQRIMQANFKLDFACRRDWLLACATEAFP